MSVCLDMLFVLLFNSKRLTVCVCANYMVVFELVQGIVFPLIYIYITYICVCVYAVKICSLSMY